MRLGDTLVDLYCPACDTEHSVRVTLVAGSMERGPGDDFVTVTIQPSIRSDDMPACWRMAFPDGLGIGPPSPTADAPDPT